MLTCEGRVTANERESEVAVVHGCFPEGDNSIKCFLLVALVSEAARQVSEFLWLANSQMSHDPRARKCRGDRAGRVASQRGLS